MFAHVQSRVEGRTLASANLDLPRSDHSQPEPLQTPAANLEILSDNHLLASWQPRNTSPVTMEKLLNVSPLEIRTPPPPEFRFSKN